MPKLVSETSSSVALRLLLSIHDVSPKFLPQIDQLHDHLARASGGARLALLVVPDHWREAPIANDAGFKRWLRDRHQSGDEILLHGWSHRDETVASGMVARIKGRHFTAGEGEFLSLGEAEAFDRLRSGKALLEDMIGAAIEGFVAPAWLYGAGTHAALRRAGFRVAEDHLRVWSPVSGDRLASGPVITWATRTRARKLSSLAVAAAARPLLSHSATVRIAVHPGDTSSAAVLDSIERTVGHFCRTHQPGGYHELARIGPAYESPVRMIPQELA